MLLFLFSCHLKKVNGLFLFYISVLFLIPVNWRILRKENYCTAIWCMRSGIISSFGVEPLDDMMKCKAIAVFSSD